MLSVKCIYQGRKNVQHELTITVHDQFIKWGADRKHSHLTSIGKKTYGSSVYLLKVSNAKTGEVYCG